MRSVFQAFILICFMSNSSFAQTFYVAITGNNANPGTAAQPWRTIAKAASTLTAGQTAIVNAGTYNESVTTARSGSANARITLRASGTVVTKTFTVDHSYITIDGFEMTGANVGYMLDVDGSN